MNNSESYIRRVNGTRQYILGRIRDSAWSIITVVAVIAAYCLVSNPA